MEQGGTGIEEVAESPRRTRLKTYFPETGREGQVLRILHRYLKSLERLYPGRFSFQVETSTTPEKDWGERWKQFFKPVRVTPRIVVKPPWSRVRLGKGQIPVEINPGVAFGTGTHATTKLCIQALENALRKRGLSVLDVGTGSGILSIVAAKLGAREVWGVDPDGASVENAKENVARNGVSTCVRIRRGTIGRFGNTFDIVVANIDLRVLRRMRWPLVRHLASGGLLILSGLLDREKERIEQRYLETGLLAKAGAAQMEEWVCLTFRKKR
jgi:ribosomal protein L11 methyltransferase